MANSEGGTRFSAKRRSLAVPVATLLFGLLLGLVIPHPYRWVWGASAPVAPVAPAEPFVLGEWEYPKAKSLAKLEGGSTELKRAGVPVAVTFAPNLYAYSTPDGLEKVWSHYAKLSGIDMEHFKPGSTYGKSESAAKLSSSDGSSTIRGTLYYTG
jgi:hypothetical protein